MEKIRVLLADDHQMVRAGLRMLINATTDLEVVGEANDGDEAVLLATQLRPHVVVMDISMPRTSGMKAIEPLRKACPDTRVLVLSMHDDPAYVRTVIASGGSGYVLKRAADRELLTGIRAVHQGRTFLDPSLAGGLVRDILSLNTTASGQPRRRTRGALSPRERDVLRLLAQGHTNQKTADNLFLSIKTVETYRARLGRKLGLRSRVDLVNYALQMGLLKAGDPSIGSSPER